MLLLPPPLSLSSVIVFWSLSTGVRAMEPPSWVTSTGWIPALSHFLVLAVASIFCSSLFRPSVDFPLNHLSFLARGRNQGRVWFRKWRTRRPLRSPQLQRRSPPPPPPPPLSQSCRPRRSATSPECQVINRGKYENNSVEAPSSSPLRRAKVALPDGFLLDINSLPTLKFSVFDRRGWHHFPFRIRLSSRKAVADNTRAFFLFCSIVHFPAKRSRRTERDDENGTSPTRRGISSPLLFCVLAVFLTWSTPFSVTPQIPTPRWSRCRQKLCWLRTGSYARFATRGSSVNRTFSCTGGATTCHGSWNRGLAGKIRWGREFTSAPSPRASTIAQLVLSGTSLG